MVLLTVYTKHKQDCLMKHFYPFFFACLITLLPQTAQGAGKLDVGIVQLDVDIVSFGQVTQNLKMRGVSGSGVFQLYKAWILKPGFALAEGDGSYYGANLATGLYLPLNDQWAITPGIGGSWSQTHSLVDLTFPIPLTNANQDMNTLSSLLEVGVVWTPQPCLSFQGAVQWAWVQTKTSLPPILIDNKTESSGFNYLGQVEYFISERHSVNAGAAWYSSRSRESHGSDVLGVRLGTGFRF